MTRDNGGRSSVLSLLLILAHLGVLVAAGGSVSCGRASADGSLAELWSALGGVRPVEGRIAGDLAYARFKAPAATRRLRGRAAPGARTVPIEFLHAASDVADRAKATPSPESERRLAAVDLLRGDVDAAVARLEATVRDDPDDAAPLNDLAAAYLEQARVTDRPSLVVEALERIERAVELAPDLAEVRFNRALVLDRFGVRRAATDAWRAFLERDGDSGWAVEARERLAHLEALPAAADASAVAARLSAAADVADEAELRRLVREAPNAARGFAKNALLARWAEAESTGRTADAAPPLASARVVADELYTLQGDAFLRDEARAIDAASPTARAAIARGQLVAGRARAAANGGHMSDARELYGRAAAGFAGAGDRAGALSAERSEADATFLSARNDRALREADRVQTEADRLGYVQIAALAWWLRGTLHHRTRELDDAQLDYEAALTRLDRCGFPEGAASVHTFLAEVLADKGRVEEGYTHLREALRGYSDVTDPGRRVTILNELATLLTTERRYRAALAVQTETVRLAEEAGAPSGSAAALRLRAVVRSRLGRGVEAAADLAAAGEHARAIEDSAERPRAEADLRLAELECGTIPDAAAQAAACDEVEREYGSASDRTRLLRAKLFRSRAEARLGDPDAAEGHLRDAVNDVLRTRGDLRPEDRGATFLGSSLAMYFDTPRSVFDEMVAFQLDARTDPEAALAVAELARRCATNRPAPDSLPEGPTRATALRDSLPDGSVLLEYACAGDRIFAWAVDRERGVVWREIADPAAVVSLAEAYRDALEDGRSDASVEAASCALYDALVRPFAASFEGRERLVIAPDRALWDVPFAALRDREDGRFLVERIAVAEVTEGTRPPERPRFEAGDCPIVFGSSRVDAGQFPAVAPLPEAENEARAVAGIYPGARLAVGPAATKRAFVAALPRASTAHFAGHGLEPGPGVPEPALLLASDPGAPDAGGALLGASEIRKLRLDRTRLVVLSACQTGRASNGTLDLGGSAAGAFAEAGVPAVVSTLWDVEDRAAAAMVVEFHRRLAAGATPEEALRAASVALAHSPDPNLASPATWGAFYLLGWGDATR